MIRLWTVNGAWAWRKKLDCLWEPLRLSNSEMSNNRIFVIDYLCKLFHLSSTCKKYYQYFYFLIFSISVEPLYAQVCQQIPSPSLNERHGNECLSPIELSHLLNSFPCSLTLQRNYSYHRILPIYPLIAEVMVIWLFHLNLRICLPFSLILIFYPFYSLGI